jgi:hypothetical protein
LCRADKAIANTTVWVSNPRCYHRMLVNRGMLVTEGIRRQRFELAI